MKKFLLLSGIVAACSFGAVAEEAAPVTVYPNLLLTQISSDGRYIVSEVYGVLTFIDQETGETTTFGASGQGGGGIAFKPGRHSLRLQKAPEGRADEAAFYSAGNGRSISNQGIVVGSTVESCNAAYLEGGEWKLLPIKRTDEFVNLANAITSDSRRICGSMGRGASAMDDAPIPNQVPVVWTLGASGEYDMYVELPYPNKDYSERVPQYVTATEISDDGKTIVGQIQDYMGTNPEPIFWTEDADGKWSYTLPMKALFHPENAAWPEYPGEFDEAKPRQEAYMTQAEKDAYAAAYQEYVDSGYDYTKYPKYEDFMTEDEKALYDADVAAWQVKFDAWDAKNNTWMDYYEQFVAKLPIFTFNQNLLSFDGHYFMQNQEDDSDPLAWFPTVINTPYLIDIQTGEYGPMATEGKNLMPTYINDDCVVLCAFGDDVQCAETYIAEGAKGTFGPFADWLLENSYDEVNAWVLDNMEHEVLVGYEENPESGEYEEKYEKKVITGLMKATPHMKGMISWAVNNWSPADDTEAPWVYSYSWNLGDEDGIKNVGHDNATKQVMDRTYYDLQGRRISRPAAGTVVIEKVTYTDGTVSASKIAR